MTTKNLLKMNQKNKLREKAPKQAATERIEKDNATITQQNYSKAEMDAAFQVFLTLSCAK
jgi:hypothetical protein